MSHTHGAATCRWAVPTLLLPRPIWFQAADRPWTCVRDNQAHTLDTTDSCRTCARWEPRVRTPARVSEPGDEPGPQPYFLDVLAALPGVAG